MTIETRFRRIKAEIDEALERSGRSPGDVRIVAVSKTVDRDAVDCAYAAGIRDFGENRMQDALKKFDRPLPPDARLHLIGSLQTNKARDAVKLFQVIHSVDRISLVDELIKRAEASGTSVDVLIQVNVAGEEQKHGCTPDDAAEIVRVCHEAALIRPIGLMTIAPLVSDPEETRPVFRALRALRDSLRERFAGLDLPELSMGMTNDYVVAVEEGATMVRIGRAIFAES